MRDIEITITEHDSLGKQLKKVRETLHKAKYYDEKHQEVYDTVDKWIKEIYEQKIK